MLLHVLVVQLKMDLPYITPPCPTSDLPPCISTPPPSSLLTPSFTLFQLPAATHADWNTSIFVQESRKLPKTPNAQKSTMKICHDADEAEHKALNTELTTLLAKQRAELFNLSARYNKKIKYIDKLVNTSAHYKHKRNMNIENAKLHAEATEVNAGKLFFILVFLCLLTFCLDCSHGYCVKLPELRQMVRDDLLMQDLSKEEEDELQLEVVASREQRRLGAHPTNQAMAQDYQCQLESLNDQVILSYSMF